MIEHRVHTGGFTTRTVARRRRGYAARRRMVEFKARMAELSPTAVDEPEDPEDGSAADRG